MPLQGPSLNPPNDSLNSDLQPPVSSMDIKELIVLLSNYKTPREDGAPTKVFKSNLEWWILVICILGPY